MASHLYRQMGVMSVEQITMCHFLIGLPPLHSFPHVSFSDMMQGDNENIMVLLGITLFID